MNWSMSSLASSLSISGSLLSCSIVFDRPADAWKQFVKLQVGLISVEASGEEQIDWNVVEINMM